MDANAKAQYEAHQKELAISYGVLETAKAEGKAEGKGGRKSGRRSKGRSKKNHLRCCEQLPSWA